MQLCNVNKLIIYLIFTSLTACSKNTSSTGVYDPYEDLNAQHTEEIIDVITSLYIQHSDLIENLRAQETNDLFLPYVESYEAHKSSSVHPDIRIFFFDRSKLPKNDAAKIVIGMCFLGEFIFIDKDSWFNLNPSENLVLRYSILEGLSKDGTYKQSSMDRDGSISRTVERYEELSEEERQERIETAQRLEEKLSEDEKIAAREIRRELLLLHELGHCDLYRGHEMINSSIMNYDTLNFMYSEVMKKEECQEDLPFMTATEECRRSDIEVSYINLIQELFSTQEEEEGMNPIKPNPEATRSLYQEIFQYIQMYTNIIDHEAQNDWTD